MKCLSHQASPRSVSEISTITKAYQEVKRLELQEEQIGKFRNSSQTKKHKKKKSIEANGATIDL